MPRSEAAEWEILPQDAGPGEVIVSKRNELGLLSNFAATPFVFRGRRYASLEGFWQMMKYPEGPEDERARVTGGRWPHAREDVGRMVGFEAKSAGRQASEIMAAMDINWVTFEGRRMVYRTSGKGEHYRIVFAATWAKVDQNPRVREVLMRTGSLKLRPDHRQPADAPPAWRYCDILMEIRSRIERGLAAGRPGEIR